MTSYIQRYGVELGCFLLNNDVQNEQNLSNNYSSNLNTLFESPNLSCREIFEAAITKTLELAIENKPESIAFYLKVKKKKITAVEYTICILRL